MPAKYKIGFVALAALAAAALVLAVMSVKRNSRDSMISKLHEGKRPKAAVAVLERAVEKEPADMEAAEWLARLYLEKQEVQAAEDLVLLRLSRAPDSPVFNDLACTIFLKKGMGPLAVKACERAVEIERDAKALNRLASAYMRNGDYDSAMNAVQAALEKNPDDPLTLNNAGYVLLQLDRPVQARGYLEKAVEMKPGLMEAQRNLARTWFETGHYKEAAERLERALEQYPGDAKSLYTLARLYCYYLFDQALAGQYASRALEAGLEPALEKEMKMIAEQSGSASMGGDYGDFKGVCPSSPE